MFAQKKEKPIRLINQGTYGCVFRPGLTCEGMIDDTDKQITKIQKERETSENEVYIGEQIQQIKNHSRYFAPVLEKCNVDISTMENDELKKCDFIDNDKKANKSMNYEINKVSYVGKYTLGEYIKLLLEQNQDDSKFSKYFLNSYKIIAEGIYKLNNNGIVHYDIKENNMICRDIQKRPIIIDFGLSFVADEVLSLEGNELFDIFYANAPQYAPWCIDIDIMSYVINHIGKGMDSVKEISQLPAAIELIEEEIEVYFEKNVGMNDVFEMKEMEHMKTNLKTYFGSILNTTSTKWEKVMTELMSCYSSWDIYALSMCYLQLMNKLHINDIIEDIPFMNQFKQMLVEVVQAVPNERKTPPEVLNQLKTIMTAQKCDLEKVKSNLTEFNANEEKVKERREQFVDFKIKSQSQHDKIAKN